MSRFIETRATARFQVKKVAVLGAGVMGAQIAAHLVNVKVPVVLFDLPAKEGAKNGIESVKKNAGEADAYELKVAKNKQVYFVLKAGNHQVIGTSEMYSSESAAKDGVAAVKKAAPGAKVEDITK